MNKKLVNVLLAIVLISLLCVLDHFKYQGQVRDLTDWGKARGITIVSVEQIVSFDDRGPWGEDPPGGEAFRLQCKQNGHPIVLWAQRYWKSWTVFRENGPEDFVAEK